MMQRGIGRSGSASRFSVGIRALFTIIMLVAVPVALHAQAYYGSIVGNVSDANGAAVPGAKVTATANANDVKSSTTSTDLGAFSLAQLAVGTYTVRVTAPGFKESVTTGVEVHVSTNTGLNVALALGAVSEKVTVQADEVQVETTSAAAGEVITGSQVRELPLNGENFIGLTQLSPGVNAAASFDGVGKGLEGGVNFSVNGNPYTNNLFLVDGVNNNDMGSGRTILVYPAVDTIAEFKMIRNAFGAEYGQASGAVISITTKSGQNQFHGGFFYSGSNDKLDANDWFSNNNGTGKAKLRKNDYGYNVSGPVKKDRLWVWWNQEWNKDIDGSSYAACDPTALEAAGNFSFYGTNTTNTTNGQDQCNQAVPGTTTTAADGTKTVHSAFPTYDAATNPQILDTIDKGGSDFVGYYPLPNAIGGTNGVTLNSAGDNWAIALNQKLNWSEWNVRPDVDLNKSNRVTFRFTDDSWTNPFPNAGASGFWGEGSFPTVGSNWSQPSKSIMAKLSSTLSSSMVNDVEFGYGHNAIITTLAGADQGIVTNQQTDYPALFPASLKQADEFGGGWNPGLGYGNGAAIWNIAPYKNHEDLYTVTENLSKVQGNHLLKIGAFYSNNAKIEDGGVGADRPSLPTNVSTDALYAGVKTDNSVANILVPGEATNGVTGYLPQGFQNVSEGSTDMTAQVAWHDFEWYFADSWKVSRRLSVDLGFRWSFFREPYSKDAQWANWSLADWTQAKATTNSGDSCNGLVVIPGKNPCGAATTLMNTAGIQIGPTAGGVLSSGTPGNNNALVDNNNHDIAPRIGVSWDILGNGKTALRLGLGQFYQREIVGIDEGMEKGTPFSLSASSTRTIDKAPVGGGASLSPNYAKDPRAVTPNSWQWNVTVEQSLAKNTTLEVGYVGNTGIHLTSMKAFNPIPQSNWLTAVFDTNGTSTNPERPANNFGQIQGFAREGQSTYHSLQALFRSQVGASSFQASYTWSHSIGDVTMDDSSGTADSQAVTVNGQSILDKGNTNINRPQIFVANEVYYLPKLANKNIFLRETVGGWQLNSIFNYAHGSSLTVFSNGSFNNNAVSQLIGTGYNGNNRPLVTGVGCNAGQKGIQILNPNAFTLVGYALGTAPKNMEHRGYCYGAATTDWDAQVAKNWEIKEKYRIKFAVDFFDLLNHANFNTSGLEGAGYGPSTLNCGAAACGAGNTTTTVSSVPTSTATNLPVGVGSSFGQVPSGALVSGKGFREVQYSLKFSF